MIRAQDEILMAEHLAVHRSRIDIIDQKLPRAEGEVAALLSAQRDLLADHVTAMQDLLEGREPTANGRHGGWPAFLPAGQLERVADRRYSRRATSYRDSAAEVVENAWISRHLAVENLRSALQMDDNTAQWVHVGMALDQVEFAIRWSDLAKREGFMEPTPSARPLHRAVERSYAGPALHTSRMGDR